jgi:hypothetical protein
LLFSLLEDLSEVITPQHCLDMIGWLEQHRPLLNSESFISGPAAVNAVRVCWHLGPSEQGVCSSGFEQRV